MSQDCPPLALDDLVHLASPSPTPLALLDDPDMPHRTTSTSPEPLPESDVFQMRKRVAELRHIDKSHSRLTSREEELAEMVCKLTAVVRPDPDQILRQAEVISALTCQRDLLLHQAEEQRMRWDSEKDGWARMAEALLARQAKIRLSSGRDEDYERALATETDNKSLRQRLSETQSRLQMLESELTRLRPLLLMQPLISRSSMPPPTPNPKTQYAKRRKKDTAAIGDEEHGVSEGDGPADLNTPSRASHFQATPKAKSRKPEAHSNKRRLSQKASSRGLSADARAEHLLLAARKIGKHRAGIMSGIMQHWEDQERERRREESATTAVAITPKTPKRNLSHTRYPHDRGYVYFNGQMRPGPGMQPVPLFIPTYSNHLLQTPSSSTTAPSSAQQSAQKPMHDPRSNNPPTPLDSLLSAARSMMREDIDAEIDGDEEVDIIGDSPGKLVSTRHARIKDTLGSPVPKRRKVAARNDKPTPLEFTSRATDIEPAASSGNANVGRVMSALDVLADQAAAFAPSQMRTHAQMKGKEKEDDTRPQEMSSPISEPRGSSKPRRNESEVDASSSVAPTSRSVTPRSDFGDHLTNFTRPTLSRSGDSASEVPIDSGGGTSSASTSNPSSQTLDSAPERNQLATHDSLLSDAFLHADDSTDVTPRQVPRKQSLLAKEGSDATNAQQNLPILAPLSADNEHGDSSPSSQHCDTTRRSDPGIHTMSVAKNKELARVAEQDLTTLSPPTKRQRSPYVKWSKEEDDLLAQAVAKYGQKWDLVQKALPSRGYHQVRQRWLRKLGVFDSKPDLSSFQTAATTFSSSSRGDGVEPKGNPKLGLAPLSSERAFSGLGRRPSLPS